MKRHTIPGWTHEPGVHCASTALSDVAVFQGLPLSEAMCFGLGAGLGFAYFESPDMSPTRMTATRSRLLEPRFFQSLGMNFEWITEHDAARALASARRSILADAPVLMRSDIAHLPHYKTSTHFPPHVIVMWGFDDEKETAYVSDTQFPGLQEVPYSNLALARSAGNAYIKNRFEHFPAAGLPPDPDLAVAGRTALFAQARDLLEPPAGLAAVTGLAAMETAARALVGWKDAPDPAWCARWFHQVIEKRGTGGGAFRLLYSRFLEELAALDPSLGKAAPAREMAGVARDWTVLSGILKDLSETERWEGFGEAGRLLDSIRRKESDFMVRVCRSLA